MNSTKRNRRVLFLYSELASYVLSSLLELASRPHLEIHVIHFPVNPDAPFDLDLPEKIRFYNRSQFDNKQLFSFVKNLQPDLIYCAGWIDKGYLKAIRAYKSTTPVLLAMDTPWKGSWRQHVAVLLGKQLRSGFTHAWVAGERQKKYAIKLGFKTGAILTGVYACDIPHFSKLYNDIKSQKSINKPKRFLYIGRYAEEKGLETLWNAFIKLHEYNPNDWELWCAGTGVLQASFPKHPKIKDLGFVQPSQMKQLIADTSVLVLPSYFEPWGVVVHEFAAAGFPLLCSHEVGAAERFLIAGINGFSFPQGDEALLMDYLYAFTKMSDEDFKAMSESSVELANRYKPSDWADQITNLL